MSVIITTTDNTIIVDGQPYPRGSIRPFYRGDYVDLIFPYWNNQSLVQNVKWSDISGDGNFFTSKADFQTFFDENMASGGDLSVPAAQFTVGDGQPGTPLNGTDTYYNPNMSETSKISKNGVGYLVKDVDYTYVAGGGFEMPSDNLFATDQVFVIFY